MAERFVDCVALASNVHFQALRDVPFLFAVQRRGHYARRIRHGSSVAALHWDAVDLLAGVLVRVHGMGVRSGSISRPHEVRYFLAMLDDQSVRSCVVAIRPLSALRSMPCAAG